MRVHRLKKKKVSNIYSTVASHLQSYQKDPSRKKINYCMRQKKKYNIKHILK